MKVVILADSLALPREEVGGERCFEVCYPYLLHESLRDQFGKDAPLIIERGMRLRTVEAVLTDWHEQVELRNADVVVVHVGVVDCAPRVFLRRENAFLANRPKWMRDPILKFVHEHRRWIIQHRPRVYVPLARFQRHVEEVTQLARTSKVQLLMYVNIVEPPDAIEQRSPGFQQNVRLYNDVLAKQTSESKVQYVDVDKLIKAEGGSDILTIDGVHLNERAHQLLASRLTHEISNLYKFLTQSELTGVHA